MKKNIKVSVVIPVYNAEKYIKRCLESILEQTYSNVDIIVIDDGSKDSSRQIIENIAQKENKINFTSRENKGVLKTRQEAIEKSTGDYIMFVDADDYIKKDMLQNMIEYIEKGGYDVVRCGLEKVNNNDEIIQKVSVTNDIVKCKNKQDIQEIIYPLIIEKPLCNSMCCQLIKKSKINMENLNFSIAYAEDLSFNLELYSNIKSIILLPENYYCYRENYESKTNIITIENTMKDLEDTVCIYQKFFNYIKIWNIDTITNRKKVAIRILNEIAAKILKLCKIKNITKKEEKNYISEILKEPVFHEIRKNITILDIKKYTSNNRVYLIKQLYNGNVRKILVYNIFYRMYLKIRGER